MDANELARSLIARGHLTEEAVVRGDLLTREVSRRHSSFIVTRQQSSLFVKHSRDERGEAAQTLQREARFYWLDSHGHTPQLSHLLPRFRDYDPTARALVLDWIPSQGTLSDALRRGQLTEREATLLGSAVATIACSGAPSASLASLLGGRKPWILTLHHALPGSLRGISGGQSELLQQLRQRPQLTRTLEDVNRSWRFETLVHGDLKLDNCLLEVTPGSVPSQLRIVDWELVDWGDPAWDVATVLQSWISHGILAGLITGTMKATTSLAQDYWTNARRCAGCFWRAYVAHAPRLRSGLLAPELVYLQAHVAARLIVTAYEALHRTSSLTPLVVHLLEAAERLAAFPGQLSALLGLEQQ